MKTKLLKTLRRNYYWKYINGNWMFYDRAKNIEVFLKTDDYKFPNDCLIYTLLNELGYRREFKSFEQRKFVRRDLKEKQKRKQYYSRFFKNNTLNFL